MERLSYKTLADTIHEECNKPLQSKWYVDSKGKSKFAWKYKSTSDFTVRKAGGLWLCYDRNKTKKSDIVKEQQKLYNRLKREYEKSLQVPTEDVELTTLTKEDKLQTITRQKTVKLLSGLACAPKYDRIYATM